MPATRSPKPPRRPASASRLAEHRPPAGGFTASAAGPSFAGRVIAWHARAGRHDLPWQNTRDPYRIWLSEVMLQQTQVAAVIPYYRRFVDAFPDIGALARAPLDDVLALWSGLGYYRRARHLHAAANVVVTQHRGAFPRDLDAIAALPGVGRSTAAAIAAFAFGTRAAILDGNVKRVFARHRGVEGFPGVPAVERRLWQAAEAALPACDVEAYTQGMMDLGATLCVRMRPCCAMCPVRDDCVAHREHRTGSLPTPRPARTVPQRSVGMLVIERGTHVLLERRADTGVWAGLWSLPECGVDEDAAAVCARRYGVAPLHAQPLLPIEHAFTHYRLAIQPWRVACSATAGEVHAPGRMWVSVDEALRLGLPAPVKRLLGSMAPHTATLL